MAGVDELIRDTGLEQRMEAYFDPILTEFSIQVPFLRQVIRLYRMATRSRQEIPAHVLRALVMSAIRSMIPETEGGGFRDELFEEFVEIARGEMTPGQVFRRDFREDEIRLQLDQGIRELGQNPRIQGSGRTVEESAELHRLAGRMRREGVPQGFTWVPIFARDLLENRIPDFLFYFLNTPARFIFSYRLIRFFARLAQHAYRIFFRNQTSRMLVLSGIIALFTAYFSKNPQEAILDVFKRFFSSSQITLKR